MKVALYQEGEFHCAPEIIKIFSTFNLAKVHIPRGYVLKDTISDLCAESDEFERWLTIDEYQVIETHDIGGE